MNTSTFVTKRSVYLSFPSLLHWERWKAWQGCPEGSPMLQRMMSRFNLLLIALMMFSVLVYSMAVWSVRAQAQPLQMQVVAQALQSPYLSDYERSPGALVVTVGNPTAEEVRFKVVGTLKLVRQNRIVASIKSTAAREVSVAAQGSVTLQAPDILDASWLEFSEPDRELALRTNRIPEGEYELCVSIVDARTLQPLQTSLRQPVCRQFRTQTPQAPRLLAPQNAQAVAQLYPQFSWTPTFFVSGRTALYVVTICKMLPGQTPRQALEGNVPLVKSEPQQGTSFSYPATAEQLDQITDAASFVWQVQAVDENGTPIGENNGKSEIFTFLPPKGSTGTRENTSAQSTGAQAALQPTGGFLSTVLSGTISASIGGTLIPMPGAQVYLQVHSQQNTATTVLAAETNTQGRFSFANNAVKAEQYTLRVRMRGAERVFSVGIVNVGEHRENLAFTIELPSYQAQLMLIDSDGKPVSGARVNVSRASDVFALKGEPALNLQVTSNAAGVAVLNGLIVSGNVQDFYIATIEAPGYKRHTVYLQSTKAGLVSERVRLERAGLRVFGVVRQGTSVLANAAVHLVSNGKTLFQSISDNDGTYTIDAPASVIAVLSSQAREALQVYALRDELRGEPIAVRSSSESVEVNLTLPLSATTFTGLVLAKANGQSVPLAGASVRDMATGNSAASDAQGRFSLKGSGSRASVLVSRAGFEDKEAVIEAQGSEIVLTQQGNWLEVKVTDAKTNKPIIGAQVALIDNAGTAATDAQGRAMLKGFPQYVRSLTVYAAGYGVETVDFLPSSGLAAEPLAVRLVSGGVVMGTVKDESGKAIAGATVSLAGYENVLEAKTDATGAFKLDNAPAGDVRVVARAVGMVSAKADVALKPGAPQTVALVLKKLPSNITSIAGFDVRIDAVREEADAFVVSGIITNLKPSKQFASLVPNVNFQNVKVTKTSVGTGNALPVGGKFNLVERELAMKFASEFPVKARNATSGAALEVVIEQPGETQGVLKGAVLWQLQEYVSDVAAGARADVEEVGILVAKPLLGKDGAELSFGEEHLLASGSSTIVQTSESEEYRAACQKTPTITVSGVTLAVVCDNFTVDAANKNASFGARATLPENPLALDTLTINPVKMGKTWGFQSADVQFSPGLSYPLASSGWQMTLRSISITNTGVRIGGSFTVSVAPSIPVNGITFTNVGVGNGTIAGGSFSTNPNEFDVYGITKVVAPTLSVTIAGDSIEVRAANGKLSLVDADWQGLTIPTFRFARRLDSLRRVPNLPAFRAPNINAPANRLRRPSFPALGKINASLLRIVSVELSGIDFNDQNELVVDGGVAFQFPALQVQAGNFIFGKNKFVVRKFGFKLESGSLNAGMNIAFAPASGGARARFNGDANVEIKKGTSPFLALAAAVMYESSQVWSVDFVANIPPVQLIPAPPPGVPIWLSSFGGGIERSNSDFRLSLQCTLQNAPTRPAPMDITLGATVWTTGKFEGTALMNVVGEKIGDGKIAMDVVSKDATGTINLGLTKGGVTATGSVNVGVFSSKKGDYFVDATTQLTIPSLLTANGRFYYGVETKTEQRTVRRRITVMPTPAANTPPVVVQELKSIGEAIDKLNDIIEEYYYYRKDVPVRGGPDQTRRATYPLMFRNTAGFYDLVYLGNYTLDRVEEVLKNLPAKTQTKTTLNQDEAINTARRTLAQTVETPSVGFPYTRFKGMLANNSSGQYSFANADQEKISVPVYHNFVAMLYGSPDTGPIMAAPQLVTPERFADGIVKTIGRFELANPRTAPAGTPALIAGEPFDSGRKKYAEIIGRLAEIFWIAGISPRDVTQKDTTLTETVDFKDGKMIVDVSATIANQSKSMSIGALGSVSFYGRGDGRFYLQTSRDFRNGFGNLNFTGATGFNVRVVKLTVAADASLNGNFNLTYSPSATTFNGAIAAQLDARAVADGCCRSCTPDCNDYCTRFLYAAVRACIGVNANMSYANRQFSFDIARR